MREEGGEQEKKGKREWEMEMGSRIEHEDGNKGGTQTRKVERCWVGAEGRSGGHLQRVGGETAWREGNTGGRGGNAVVTRRAFFFSES